MRAAPLLLLLCRMSPGGSWMHVGSLPRAIHSCAPAGWSQLSHRSTERQKDVLSLHAEAGSSRPRRGDTEVMSGGSRGSAAGPWTCERINATSHAAVNAFFKAQGYKVACKPRDRVWVLLSSENVQSPDDRGQLLSSEIVGAVRLTPQRYKPLGDVFFLRSLCIDAGLRRQGLGTLLTRAATADSAGTPRYCFALEELVPLYTRTGWAATPPHMLPQSIRDRFRAVTDQTARKSKSIALLSHGLPVPAASSRETEVRAGDEGQTTRIILLQHAKEAARKTATGALLSHPSLAAHINLERWVWQGRSDNARINDLVASRPCVLVWADKSSFQGAQAGLPLRDACYVILDGTWQEASSMFRKCHALHRLPRLTLKPAVSTFKLRSDYGWRAKLFGLSQDGRSKSCAPQDEKSAGGQQADEEGLLCTAETGAALLELAGDHQGAEQTRQLLASFQAWYAQSHPHVWQRGLPRPRQDETVG